ncbi:MAG: MBL fold metallo-hydrolase [Mariniphaga sp.]|nr:MBL fold metallo-hydrolase [Mariniphaga sp.]
MEEIKIIQIHSGFVTPILVVNGGNSFLVDTGRKAFGQKIIQAIEINGLKPTDIKLIILTHTHFDHAGNAALLKEKTGAKVVVHKKEKDCLEKGYMTIPRGTKPSTKRLSWLGRNIFRFIGKYKSVKADIVVEDKLDLTPWGIDGYVLHTPGHTAGSQSVVLGDAILAGDAFFNAGFEGVFPPFADHPKQLLETWEKIIELGINKVYPGHGSGFNIAKVKESFNAMKKKFV